jgi:hypothetical protein
MSIAKKQNLARPLFADFPPYNPIDCEETVVYSKKPVIIIHSEPQNGLP